MIGPYAVTELCWYKGIKVRGHPQPREKRKDMEFMQNFVNQFFVILIILQDDSHSFHVLILYIIYSITVMRVSIYIIWTVFCTNNCEFQKRLMISATVIISLIVFIKCGHAIYDKRQIFKKLFCQEIKFVTLEVGKQRDLAHSQPSRLKAWTLEHKNMFWAKMAKTVFLKKV